MKKVFVFLVVVLVAAVLAWVGLRSKGSAATSAVTELLPADTLVLLHFPDYLRTRDEWHRSDIYQIWREPTVQAFLQKPLAKLPKNAESQQVLADIARLEPKDFFIALTALGDDPKTAAGFRFKGDSAEVEKVIAKAKNQLFANFPTGKRDLVAYQGHNIDTFVADRFTFASVYDGQWYFAGNDLAGLKLILDRADGRVRDAKTALKGDETFAAALKHMTSPYAALIYVKPQPFVEKLVPLLAMTGQHLTPEDTAKIRELRSICATTAFDNGKLHDIAFIGMPEAAGLPKLTRNSLSFASKSAFLYFASQLNLSKQIHLPDATADTTGAMASVQKVFALLAAQGVTLEEWNASFGTELSVIGDWRAEGRWPSVLVSLPVKDAARAKKMAAAVTSSGTAGTWQKDEHDGMIFYSMPAISSLVSVGPIIAVSDKLFVAGLDRASVQQAIAHSSDAASELAASENYRGAASTVASPTSAFVYVDTRMLFERLDATLRPMLLMGAALFVPAVSQNADLSKLPPTEAVAKHLSPIVMSQSYQSDGYVTDSVGPVTINEAGLGLGAAFAGAMVAYQQRAQFTDANKAVPSGPPALNNSAPILPDPSPSSTPDATP